jgi:hypothetical protein
MVTGWVELAEGDVANDDGYAKVVPEEECEYCAAPLVEGCNEFGSILDDADGMEYPCPNNRNQFPPRRIPQPV